MISFAKLNWKTKHSRAYHPATFSVVGFDSLVNVGHFKEHRSGAQDRILKIAVQTYYCIVSFLFLEFRTTKKALHFAQFQISK